MSGPAGALQDDIDIGVSITVRRGLLLCAGASRAAGLIRSGRWLPWTLVFRRELPATRLAAPQAAHPQPFR